MWQHKKDRKSIDGSLYKSDELVINCLRSLAMDAVEKAKSGHPGTPMAMAPVAYTLWARVLRYDPTDPMWPNRDRFVLSMGHASMLLYGLLHVAGVRNVEPDGKVTNDLSVTIDDIKQFRQYGSKCPGHPEHGETTGVEATTGPLGQGVASSVGMAIASKWQQARFNKAEGDSKFKLFDYDVYALCGDGCMQEGVSHEAASLAGHLRLDNLCWIWDNNHITIDGNTAWATSEDLCTRFIAYGWNVLRVGDANDAEALHRAFLAFRKESSRPTFIVVDSHIAWGSPAKQDSFTAHGAPLGPDEVKATKKIYGWSHEPFVVPDEVLSHIRGQMDARGGAQRREWDAMASEYAKKFPEDSKTLQHMLNKTLPAGWDRCCKDFPADAKGLATRQSSSQCMNMVAKDLPWMVGGSADLNSSCLTVLKDGDAVDHFMPSASGWGDYSGRNVHFGIREHAMGSIMNGMALSSLRPFGATFLVFSDYMKPPIRLSSIMEIPSIWIFTHDSIGVGEDGPTHQPIEQLNALRAIPGLYVFRPGDANEALQMWKWIMPLVDDPVAVVLSRQNLPTLDRTKYSPAEGVQKGGYVLASNCAGSAPEVLLMSSGSEIHLMLEAHEALAKDGVKVQSASIPCIELFKHQSDEYINSVLPRTCRARVSIEAARRDAWNGFIGLDGEHIGMITFGSSAPMKSLHGLLGFTVESVVASAKRVMTGNPRSWESRSAVAKAWKRRKLEPA